MKRKIVTIISLLLVLGGSTILVKEHLKQAENVDIYESLQKEHESILGKWEPVVTEDDLVQIPVDFEALKEINEDIYAWIDIEDTNIHYPIVQSSTDDSYYLEHTIEHVKGLPGSIYTESINSKDFSDFNTLIYGHDMRDGSMFKHLHQFADSEFFESHDTVMIYTEDAIHEYRVLAAVAYDNRHIMYSFDQSDEVECMEFVESLYETRNLRNQYREGIEVNEDSRLITLSTCITGQPEKRWIVVCVEI